MKTDVTKVGRLLFFIGLLGLWSCEKEPILTKESIQEVPSISQARGTFLELQYNSRGRSTAIPLEGKVDWQASTAKDLTRKLKMLYTPVALESHYAKSFIASIQQQEKVQNRVFTVLYDEQHSTQAFSGVILTHNNKGDFVKAYEYVAGKRTKTYLPKVDGQGSRGRATNNDCSLTLEDIRIIVETFGLEGLNNLIPCLDIHADLDDGSNDGGGDNGLGDGNPLDVPLGDLDDNDNPGGGSSTGNGHTPWWDNNNNNTCKGGKVKDANGKCKCPQGQVEGLNGICACPQGYVKDSKGNCVKKPCVGDPVKDPEIAPQKNSGIRGGMFGWTRKQWKNSKLVPLKHEGTDLKNPYGAPVYALFDGHSQAIKKYYTKAGWIVFLSGTINGKKVNVQYFHMQKGNRKTGYVKAGDVIGYQGDSGNLKKAISDGDAVSHVHLKAKENGKLVDALKYLKTKIDPKTGKVIKPCK